MTSSCDKFAFNGSIELNNHFPQDPVLFSGSLRLNLDPLEKYPDSEV